MKEKRNNIALKHLKTEGKIDKKKTIVNLENITRH